LINRKKLINFF